MSDRHIINTFDTLYNEAYYAWNPYYPEAELDLRYYLGDQWDNQEKQKLFQDGRSTFVFNHVRKIVDFITGYQRQHRASSIILPIEDKDQLASDQLTQLIAHVMMNSEGYRAISDAFSGAMKTGWNLLSIYVDYSDDPINGDIKFNRESYNSFVCDPYFMKQDFSDCNYILRRKYLSQEMVNSMLPGMEKEIADIHKFGWDRDDKFTWLPYQRQPSGMELMAYNEMYQLQYQNVWYIVNQETGEFRKWPGPEDLLDQYLAQFPEITKMKKSEAYIEMTIIVNDQVMKTVVNPYGLNEYPFVPFFCLFEPESDQWDLKVQSKIRAIRDPQKESNRRRSQMVDILDSQINSGWIATEDSVVNPSSLFQSSQGRVIWRKMGAEPGALEKIQPAQVPGSIFQLQELFDRDINQIAGVNDAAFGEIQSANESGVMQMIRQGSSIANLQEIMDNLRYSQKALTKKVVKLIQQWTPQKIQRIINAEPAQELFDPDLSKYDISIQEGIQTDTQKQMYFRQLVDLKQIGAPVTGEMLAKAAPIQGKTEYIQQIEQMEQQQAQQAQQMQQLQMRQLQSVEQMQQAKAISDVALGKERFTRAVANTSLSDERAAAAVEDRSDAALNRVKAIQEMQTIEDDRFIKYLQIIRMMEDMSRKEENEIKKDDLAVAQQGTMSNSFESRLPV